MACPKCRDLPARNRTFRRVALIIASTLPPRASAKPHEPADLTLLDYDRLVRGHDYSREVARAYSHDGLGILAVVGAPSGLFEKPRTTLLHLARQLALSNPHKLEAYERPELSYANGWSRGKEIFHGKPDTTKGSWYSHALEDAPAHGDATAHRYPLISAPNIWPTSIVGHEFESSFKLLARALFDLSAYVLANADKALQLQDPHKQTTSLLSITHNRSRLHVGRLLHYYAPSSENSTEEGDGELEIEKQRTMWCGWHNDNSVITVIPPALWLDEMTGDAVPADVCPTGGLIVRTRKGRTVEVRVPAGGILFQLGEAAQIVSGGSLMATPHAVRTGSPGLSRESFVLFVEPHWDEMIGEADKLQDLHDCDAANEDVIPSLSRRLPKLPVEFGQFLADSFTEYYSSNLKS